MIVVTLGFGNDTSDRRDYLWEAFRRREHPFQRRCRGRRGGNKKGGRESDEHRVFTLATFAATSGKPSVSSGVTSPPTHLRTISAGNERHADVDDEALRELLVVWPGLSQRIKRALRDLAISSVANAL